MAQASKDTQSTALSPMIWVIIATIVLIMIFVFFSGRSGTKTEKISLGVNQNIPKFSGDIKRPEVAEIVEEAVVPSVPVVKGARELIRQARENKRPYPLEELYQKALAERANNNMENAHLLFFFCAREGHLPSILMMGEMADPLLFKAENSLLDQADPVQAFKWYRIAVQRGDVEAQQKLLALQQWAEDQAALGDKTAQQLLLSFN